MNERDLRLVRSEGHDPFAATTDSSDPVRLDDAAAEQDPSSSDSQVTILVEPAGDSGVPAHLRPMIDPNTGEHIVHPSLQGSEPQRPETFERPAAKRNGRLRDYLRLVEGP